MNRIYLIGLIIIVAGIVVGWGSETIVPIISMGIIGLILIIISGIQNIHEYNQRKRNGK